jgi:Fur family zinc uptake transcriptional regulator
MALSFISPLLPHHDHNLCREKALQTADRICDNRGVRLTPMRRQVLELIWESHKAIKAYDLLQRITPKVGTTKPVTVYRALNFLMEQGLIHKVESLNAFIGCRFSDHQHQQLLLTCSHCQEVEERPAEGVMEAIDRELEQASFTIYHKAIEIHGICAHCAQIDASANNIIE